MTKNPTEAEDLTHDAFEIALANLPQFRGSTAHEMFGWLRMIAFRHWVYNAKRHTRVVGHYDDEDMPSCNPSPLDLVILGNVMKKVQHELLTSDDAEILARAFAEETQDYKRLAKKLNLPVGTIKSKVCRFRQRLRETFPGIFKE